MKKNVEDLLIQLGVYPNLLGFDYICKAVEILQKYNGKVKIVDGVYADIAKEFDSTKEKVERAIRNAISKMDKDSEECKKYIGVKDATNSVVLHTIELRLREN